MLRKLLSLLIILSISGYFIIHDLKHIWIDSATASFHSDSLNIHHYHPSKIVDPHEHPSEADHPHLEGLFFRSSKQNSLENKFFLQTALIPKSFLESPDQNRFKQLSQNGYSIDHFPPFNFRNSPLRI